MSQTERFGRCLCRSVRYRIVGDVADAFYCHCESCRRSAGAPVVAWGRVDEDQFRLVQGELTKFHSSPGVTRSRCAKCGTEICYQHEEYRPHLDVLLATLESPDDVPPTYHVRMAEKVSWCDLDDALPKYEGWRPQSPS